VVDDRAQGVGIAVDGEIARVDRIVEGPLDRPGSIKGGPYSDGAFDGTGQFGLLDIADEGDTISVTTTGVNWDGDVLVERTFTFDVP